jgi:hypothetical protein
MDGNLQEEIIRYYVSFPTWFKVTYVIIHHGNNHQIFKPQISVTPKRKNEDPTKVVMIKISAFEQ